jgi:D-methionine transport system substrate-binding protein
VGLGNENSEKIQALVKALTSDKVKEYIDATYKGAVIPSFVDPQ